MLGGWCCTQINKKQNTVLEVVKRVFISKLRGGMVVESFDSVASY